MGEDETCIAELKLPILNMKAAAASSSSVTRLMESPPDNHYPSTHLASVPFKWEEQPGKPRPYSESGPAKCCCLELPPAMLLTPSPTAVLDGPYNVGRPKFSSFRLIFRDGRDSFDSREDGSLRGGGGRGHGLFGNKKKKKMMICSKGTSTGKKEDDDAGGISGFSPFSASSSSSEITNITTVVDDTCYYWSNNNTTTATTTTTAAAAARTRKMRRNGSFSSVPHHANKPSPLWATICEGLKQVIHWKSSRKSSINKQGQD